MTKNYKYLQSLVNYRIPINDDGTLGDPEITAKWTKEMGAPKFKKPKAKPKIVKKTKVVSVQKARVL